MVRHDINSCSSGALYDNARLLSLHLCAHSYFLYFKYTRFTHIFRQQASYTRERIFRYFISRAHVTLMAIFFLSPGRAILALSTWQIQTLFGHASPHGDDFCFIYGAIIPYFTHSHVDIPDLFKDATLCSKNSFSRRPMIAPPRGHQHWQSAGGSFVAASHMLASFIIREFSEIFKKTLDAIYV